MSSPRSRAVSKDSASLCWASEPHAQAIDDGLDRVLLVLVQGRGMVEVGDDAVDPGADEAARHQLGEDMLVFALPVPDHRREDHDARAFGQGHDLVHHLADGLRVEGFTVLRTARLANAGVEQPQVVVDLGDRADRGTRIVGGRLLFDGDRWRQAFDVVDIGLFHHGQELPRVGRQGLDVAPLSFGVERVERERRLARARQAGHHHQFVARDVEVDVLEVVGARAAHGDLGQSGGGCRSGIHGLAVLNCCARPRWGSCHVQRR